MLLYDTATHDFRCAPRAASNQLPYAQGPVVLNCYLTLNCNMKCIHCVARDMAKFDRHDLSVRKSLIRSINRSPFMAIVITGGEPLLPDYEDALLELISNLEHKGLILDTNGTIWPSRTVLDALVRLKVLVRVSMDSPRVQDEAYLRVISERSRTRPRRTPNSADQAAFNQKVRNISRFRRAGVRTAVQSVLHKMNSKSIGQMPAVLQKLGVTRWYVQRLIPTSEHDRYTPCLFGGRKGPPYQVYMEKLGSLERKAAKLGINCFGKRDRRHNCVYLLVGNGELYTQSDSLGQKIRLGRIGDTRDYFSYVSMADHCARYYCLPTPSEA